jgi:hypothetical protein
MLDRAERTLCGVGVNPANMITLKCLQNGTVPHDLSLGMYIGPARVQHSAPKS